MAVPSFPFKPPSGQSPSQGQPLATKVAAMSLTGDIVANFKPARVFQDAVDQDAKPNDAPASPLRLTSIAFDDMGDRCVTAGEDDNFTLYDARKGKKIRTLYSKKYGIAHARFTHRPQNIIHASTKGDNAIRYHSMHDNKYLAYFQGHTDLVRSIHMNPTDDTFVSAGDDGTVRLWDLRAPTCRGLINNIGGPTLAAFDSGGMVFAVACSTMQVIMLFDSSSLDAAPFAHAHLSDPPAPGMPQIPPPTFTSLAFSNNGNYLLLGTSSHVHYVIDAFDLRVLRRLEGHVPLGEASGEELSWSADSRWVFSGSGDGAVVVWDLSPPTGAEKLEKEPNSPTAPTLQPAHVLRPGDGVHAPSQAVKVNPRYSMLGVGGGELSFWLPAKTMDEDSGW